MTPVPQGPWVRDAEPIGPLQKVCPLTRFEVSELVGMALIVIFLSPFPLGFLYFLTRAVAKPRGIEEGLDILCGSWVLLSVAAILWNAQLARKRLLLGERGIAVWLPWRTEVVVFTELGTGWRSVPQPAHADQPLSILLEHTDGRRVQITADFEDYHQVALRVLEELERRAPERAPEPRAEGTTAIKPANRAITEPREEAP